MKSFDMLNPVTVLCFYVFAVCIPMFSLNPVTASASLFGAVLFDIVTNGKVTKKYAYFFLLFAVCVIINPLFNKNGSSVLFFINDTPITYESVIYGIVSGITLISVIVWFSTFSHIMTSEKIIYVFGRISPKTALIISMSVRFFPLFLKNYKEAENAVKCLGLYNCDTLFGVLKVKIRAFSALITRVTEEGIITADSMEARGYGKKRRSSFSLFKFTVNDFVYIFIFLIFGVLSFISSESTVFYPTVSDIPFSGFNIFGYVCYFLLVLMPTAISVCEGARWKYLLSKI